MEIKLGNQILNIQLRAFRKPNFEKLEKELADYFANNKVSGITIKEFELRKDGDIIPVEPYFEGSLSGGNHMGDLEKIGEKYGVKHLGFIHWCYGE